MTPAAIRAWLASKPMSTQAKAALERFDALERVAEDAGALHGGWTVLGWAILGDALAALDALKAGKEGRG